MQVFGRGHQVTCNGATVYVTRCQVMDMLPRTHTNCTNEIPAILNGTKVFANPICFVIKATPALVRCNNIAPPRWRLNGRWYCAFLEIRDCAEPGRIPMTPIAIDDIKVMILAWAGVSTVLRSWSSSRTSRRARGRGVHSWPRVPREPTTTGLEDSGTQACSTWPPRV